MKDCLIFKSERYLGGGNLDPSKVLVYVLGDVDVKADYQHMTDFVLQHSKGKIRLDIEIVNLEEEMVHLEPHAYWPKFWLSERWYVALDYLKALFKNAPSQKTIHQIVFNSLHYSENLVASAHQGGYKNYQHSSIFLP